MLESIPDGQDLQPCGNFSHIVPPLSRCLQNKDWRNRLLATIAMIRRSCFYSSLILILAIACQFHEGMAFPRNRSITPTGKFSRKRVILNSKEQSDATPSPVSRTPVIPPSILFKIDVLICILYSMQFLVFPQSTINHVLSVKLEDLVDVSLMHAYQMVVVRMVAIYHVGYVIGLLNTPPEKAIRKATAFVTIVGAFFVAYYWHAKQETPAKLWSSAFLTTVVIITHLLAL
jgi:hypothetical protein